MTAADYRSAIAAARDEWPLITNRTMRKIKEVYRKAGEDIAAILRDGELIDGQLSQATQLAFDQAVLLATVAVADVLREEVPALVLTGASAFAAVERDLLISAFDGDFRRVTKDGIEKMFDSIAVATTRNSLLTIGPDGFNFWGRVPNISKFFGDDVVNMVRAALDQGRDIGKIAEDVTRFIKGGKKYTIQRWGENLAPRSAELLRRVKFDRVDYRALRLCRSELARGLMEDAKANGASNPASTGLYDWVRINSVDHGCACPGNASNGPYTLDNYPPYAHSNCACVCRPVLRNLTEFKAELRAWSSGEPNERLDRWIQSEYVS